MGLENIAISHQELIACHQQLNTATDSSVSLVSLGNPHFSFEEFSALARLCSQRQKHTEVGVVVTTSRAIQEQATNAGYMDALAAFGVEVITDTCWCMLEEPVIPVHARNLMTNSAKYAHYAPGMLKRGVHFGSLAQCIEAACAGKIVALAPAWFASVS